MLDWLKNRSKGERIRLVLTLVWAIMIGGNAGDGGASAGEALGFFLFFWGLPVVIGWGLYWILYSPKRS
jgi:hypothetical protein